MFKKYILFSISLVFAINTINASAKLPTMPKMPIMPKIPKTPEAKNNPMLNALAKEHGAGEKSKKPKEEELHQPKSPMEIKLHEAIHKTPEIQDVPGIRPGMQHKKNEIDPMEHAMTHHTDMSHEENKIEPTEHPEMIHRLGEPFHSIPDHKEHTDHKEGTMAKAIRSIHNETMNKVPKEHKKTASPKAKTVETISKLQHAVSVLQDAITNLM